MGSFILKIARNSVLCIAISACSNVWGPLDNMYDSKVAVPTPVTGIASGTYNQDQTVSLSCAFPGAAIHYTLDGSTPTSASTLYSSPITISGVGARVTLKMLATYTNKIDSSVGSADYILDTIISTVAGNGNSGFTGDGGPASAALLNYPSGVGCDSVGNVYIADSSNNEIRKIDTGGTITLYAGGGSGGLADGQPATQATVNNPRDVVYAAGYIYFEGFNNSVCKVNLLDGKIHTVAGGNGAGSTGDGGLATDPAAKLNVPAGIAVDAAGNVYIADQNNNRIRKVTPGGVISTIAGNGTSGYTGDGGPAGNATINAPASGAIGPDGNYFFADTNNQCVRKIDLATGNISTVAGGNPQGLALGNGVPATSLGLWANGVAFDTSGNLFISTGMFVHRMNLATGLIYVVAGQITAGFAGDGGPASAAQFRAPSGLCFDSAGNLYIADAANYRIRKIAR
jgi:sugar lactone lactonase YvrE